MPVLSALPLIHPQQPSLEICYPSVRRVLACMLGRSTRMAYKRIIGYAWIAFAAWLAFGVTSQARKDRDQEFQTNAGWVVALIVVICIAIVWAACALLRGRTSAVGHSHLRLRCFS